MDFFSSPEIVENNDDDVDMFAELGVINHNVGQNIPQSPNHAVSNDPLAAFMEDDGFSVLEEIDEQLLEDGKVVSKENSNIAESSQNISEETIAELLEVLVKKELKQREQRGDDWLTDLP